MKNMYELYCMGQIGTLSLANFFRKNPTWWDSQAELSPTKKLQLLPILAQKLFCKEYSDTTAAEREKIEEYYERMHLTYDSYIEFLQQETTFFQWFINELQRLFQQTDNWMECHLQRYLEDQAQNEIEWDE